MAGALDGVRVIDFGQYIAGPLTAMLLGDQGADVVRVDPPGGPRFDTAANATWNRNKRSIVLDLKTAADLEIATRLVQTADVVVENFRPGVMDRLGLGPAKMTALNPRLVYCSLPGFGHDDPRAGIAAWEGIVGAATATYPPNPATGQPVYTAIPIASSYAAFEAAVSIAVALGYRERSGLGQTIEVPLFDATFGAIGSRGLIAHDRPPLPENLAARGWTRQFECADGRWFMYHAGNLNFGKFLEAAGAADVLDADLSLEEHIARGEALFKTHPAQHWEDLCEKVGTEGATCRPSAEWLQNEHALASKIVVEMDDPKLGRVQGPGVNVRLSETPGSVRSTRSLPDADRAAVLADLAARVTPAPAAGNAAPRQALAGVKVIDLCIILAGPTCGRTLAEFGADVIKIDSPYRKHVSNHNDVNRGKRSLILDLKQPEGLEVFWRLVTDADVVVQNFRKGVAERLGIGYEAVRARRPDIVYASLNMYGQVGPYAGRPGHEQVAQAAAGLQHRFGGGGRPYLQPFPINDYGTGLNGAYGVALALLHRQRTGQGQHVDTALAYTATMLQSALLQDFAGKQWDEPKGQDALGSGPLQRAYEASDGWLFVGARRADVARCAELTDLAGVDDAALEAALEGRMRGRTVADWVGRLTAAGIGAHAMLGDVRALMQEPLVVERGLSVTREHEDLGRVTTTAPVVHLSRTPPTPGAPASRPGSDAASILTEAGLGDEMERLVRDGVVVEAGVEAGY